MTRQLGYVTLRFECDCCGAIFDSSKTETAFLDQDGIRFMMKKLPEFWWFHVCEEGKQYGTAKAVGIVIQ
jgi:hypothetical protein